MTAARASTSSTVRSSSGNSATYWTSAFRKSMSSAMLPRQPAAKRVEVGGQASSTAPRRKTRAASIREKAHGSFVRQDRRRHLVRRQTGAVGRRQRPCADPRAALCEQRVRGRARLWRHHLQEHRTFGAAEEFGADPRFRDPLVGGRDRRRQAPRAAKERSARRLCPTDSLARFGNDGSVGAGQHHSPGGGVLEVAELFRPGAAAEGHSPGLADYRRPDPATIRRWQRQPGST